MATAIYTRSPRFISQVGTINQDVRVDLFIWNSPDSIPTTATISLSKPIPSSVVTTVNFDISPYIREYINFITFEPMVTTAVYEKEAPVGEYAYCTAKTYLDDVLQTTNEFIAFDGYGYFLDGNNPTVPSVLNDEGTFYINEGNNSEGSITIFDDSADVITVVYTNLRTGFVASIVTKTFDVACFPNIHETFLGDGNRVDIYRGITLEKTLYFEAVCEKKYDVIKCDFVNRYGVWDRINFFKVSKSKFDVNSKEYNLMPSSLDYNVGSNIKQSFNINGNDSISCNTGWVNDNYGEVIKQLMLSEEVRLDNVPVKVMSKSTDLKLGINDKNINYKIDFAYSFNTLNYIV